MIKERDERFVLPIFKGFLPHEIAARKVSPPSTETTVDGGAEGKGEAT